MRPKAPKLLEDIRDASAFVLEVVAGRTTEEFQTNRLLYQAVERNFEIIGEAMNRLSRCDPETAGRIDGFPQVIAFRNILIHGYDAVDRRVVWSVAQRDLPLLHQQVVRLLRDAPSE